MHEQAIESRVGVLRAQTRKFKLAQDVDLAKVAEALPINITGADISSLTSQAYMTSLNRRLQKLEDSLTARNEQDDCSIELSMTSFLESLDRSQFEITVTQNDLMVSSRCTYACLTIFLN